MRLGLPADAMFLHLPRGALLAVEYAVRVPGILLELIGNLPLAIIRLGRRGGDEATWENLPGVLKYDLSPPLQLPVRSRRETANERA